MPEKRSKSSKRTYILTAVDLVTHLCLTLGLAYIMYRVSGRISWGIMAFTGGVLIDLDHFVDYGMYYGFRFHPGRFFSHAYLASGKTYLFLHSWELVAGLWILSIFFRILLPLAAGMTLHLAIDMLLSRREDPKILLLWYRWKNSFSLDKLSRGRDRAL
ncbi:MAG: hypothetical protein GF392_04560 [Candidatus Omnitrophica bacterium]|nr:hypothetical protein [Candidatus Omnitrophota bacterium]